MVTSEHDELSKKAKAHSVFIRLVLPPYTIHFKSPSYLQPHILDLLDKRVCKETLKKSAQESEVRDAIGRDPKYWSELVVLLRAAVPSLERRSFTIWDPTSVDYESTSGALIAGNYPGLWRDLERLNDLVSISRNVLTIGKAAQDLAADKGADGEIFRIVNCCVRVTARGYDGDAGTGEEEKWQWVVNAYKKLLITSLQFLNNAVAQNEKRKLILWVALFDNTSDIGLQLDENGRQIAREDISMPRPQPPLSRNDLLLAYGTDGHSQLSPLELEGAMSIDASEGFKPFPEEAVLGKQKLEPNGYVYWTKRIRDMCVKDFQLAHHRNPSLSEMHLNLPRYWRPGSQHWDSQQQIYEEALAKYRHDVAAYEIQQHAKMAAVPRSSSEAFDDDGDFQQQAEQVEQKLKHLETQLAGRQTTEIANSPPFDPIIPGFYGDDAFDETGNTRPVSADDTRMLFTAEAGAKILESGKAELMKRLEGYHDSSPDSERATAPSRNHDGTSTQQSITVPGQTAERMRSMSRTPPGYRGEGDELRIAGRRMPNTGTRLRQPSEEDATYPDDSLDEDEEEESEEGEDEEEDYPGSTEDGRGLLTDVPLILGPSEIEVLPMLIMSGVVPRGVSQERRDHAESGAQARDQASNTPTLLTHLLLSQTSGRNLLRELLIFVAAWDLREEELYFKFMVKIVEAILKNGLMPYAYHAFRDRSRSKDIISPAQAVIMKLLTCIFRARSDSVKNATPASKDQYHLPALSSTQPLSTNSLVPPETYGPSKVDLHILNFIFTEFRQHIIPQTCALIFLQGQIHKGRASPEDFPLNLWDMERMYEGVYQYLEFFAVLTEDQAAHNNKLHEEEAGILTNKSSTSTANFSWKQILADWEMASELVTLLRELECGIPKLGSQLPPQTQPLPPMHQLPTRADSSPQGSQSPLAAPHPQRSMSADTTVGHAATSPAVVAIERPFDLDPPSDLTLPPLPPPASTGSTPSSHQLFEADTPLAYPEEGPPAIPSHDLQQDQDEPSDFEWRNLKKLTVLVLSSLIWKNKVVQDQVRLHGGLEALVGCCRPDEHNPYIREHAIMCLRFAIEGNEENARVIRGMADRQRQARVAQAARSPSGDSNQERNDNTVDSPGIADVPREVLDTNGYETFMDSKGQVGLRRKEPNSNIARGLMPNFVPSSKPGSQTPAGAKPIAPPPPPPLPAVPSSLAAAASSALSALQHDLGLLSASTSGAAFSGKARGGTPAAAQLTKMTAEKAAELMQSALRDLPLGDKLVTDRQKAEALARLDRAFESTEQALGRDFGERAKQGRQ